MFEEKILRTLTIQSLHIKEVEFGDKFAFTRLNAEGETPNYYKLTIPNTISENIAEEELISSLNIRIIKPYEHHVHVDSIMDIFPISVKVLGKIGEGTSRTLTGVYGMICGRDEDNNPVCAFGDSSGYLDEKMMLNKAGTPSSEDYIICFDVVLKSKAGFSRTGPDSAHRAVDNYCQPLRDILKMKKGADSTEQHIYNDIKRENAKKVVLVKLVSGQGAMYDTHYMAAEPSGFNGGRSIIDSTGSPVYLTPNELRDGAIRALY